MFYQPAKLTHTLLTLQLYYWHHRSVARSANLVFAVLHITLDVAFLTNDNNEKGGGKEATSQDKQQKLSQMNNSAVGRGRKLVDTTSITLLGGGTGWDLYIYSTYITVKLLRTDPLFDFFFRSGRGLL